MWKPTLSQVKRAQSIPETMCSPLCCCMWSKRRSQSMTPGREAPISTGVSTVWKTVPSFSWTSSTFAWPRVPRSQGWPPPSG